MNKLSRKFIAGITVILAAATLCSILFNAGFIEKYYLYQKKNSIHSICENLESEIKSKTPINDAVSKIENSDKVIIAKIDNSTNLDNDAINDEIRNAFQEKGIGFQKYWLWKEDFEQIQNGKGRLRLYRQDNLNYSLLVEYIYIDSQFFAVTMIVPNIADAFGIINTFLIFVNIITLLLAILFIFMLIRRITRPLKKFEDFAHSMEHHEFIPLEIHTNDELEQVADHLNAMGSQITSYQNSLQEKNRQMEQLLDDVAHDLKTPVSLIKLYSEGIKDGLDDGTFLTTISDQGKQMDQIINKLLFLTRVDKETAAPEECNLTSMLLELLKEYAILAAEQNLEFQTAVQDDIIIQTQPGWMRTILSNLLTNAVKYSSSTQIETSLQKNNDKIIFTISNECDNETLDICQIWNPYYVGEKSRNKHLSGSGLGLSIVKRLAMKLGYDISCVYENHVITFKIVIPST